MDALRIAEKATVADIGAGAGFFTVRLARRVGPNGIVYAEDIQQPMLESIKRRVSREGLNNVITRLGTDTDANLPKGALDAVLVVDVYQEVQEESSRIGLLRHLADTLKPNGRIGIVNYKPGEGGPGLISVWSDRSSRQRSEPRDSGCLTAPHCRFSTCWSWASSEDRRQTTEGRKQTAFAT